MIGAIIGDIVGSIYEFDNVRTKDFPLFSEESKFTDDTVCTVAVADTLLNDKDAAATLLQWCRRYSGRGYGNQFMRWINMPWQEPYNSYGNGAAMRVSPAAWLGTTLEDALALADRVTAITHNHPEGVKGARATVAAVYHARQGWAAPRIREEIEAVYGYDLSASVEVLQETNEYSETCQQSVPPALICALEATSFEDAIRNAISIGGDSDTIAAIAGGVAEALFGVDDYIRAQAMLRLNDEIRTVIDAFYRRIGSAREVGSAVSRAPIRS